jgi:hypothetical protein
MEVRELIERGKFFNGGDSIYMKMIPGQCHRNTKLLADYGFVIPYAGFAYDGQWIIHSWGLMENKVVETSAPFELYFGARL